MKTRSILMLAVFGMAGGPAVLQKGIVQRAGAEEAGAAQQAPNTLSESEKAAGWKLLFDGKTGEGWRGFKRKEMPWTIADGVLLTPGGKGDILTVDEYENFELSLEWRLTAQGNSGVLFRVKETDSEPYWTGPEYQLLDEAYHAPDLTATASCYDLYPVTKRNSRPIGEWNVTRLTVDHGHCQHWLNGELVCEYTIGSDDWNARLAKSKFAPHAGFARSAKGHIDLQDHTNEVDFRNIKIRVLP